MSEIFQEIIYGNVRKRGYLRGKPDAEIVRQVLKATEELGEVARCAFDGETIPITELADVVIPLACIAALQGNGNLLQTCVIKSEGDVKRGRRDAD